MAKKDLPPVEVLRQLLRYEPETGKLFWLERGPEWFETSDPRGPEWLMNAWNGRFAGKEAFTSMTYKGYMAGHLLSKPLLAHRLAWAIYTGKWPADQIDHININKSDNRICNLREASNSENQMNTPARISGQHKSKGVGFAKHMGKWVARITTDGNRQFLGYFDRKEDAVSAYADAAHRQHGKFARVS